MQNINKKNLYKILFIVIVLGLIISLTGCDWFSNGLFNIFDPRAQIITEYNPEEGGNPDEGCCNVGVSCINEVEFNITGFTYNYHGVDSIDGKIAISALSRVVEASFYVAPSTSPGTPGTKTIIENIPLFFQDVVDYLYLHPFITEITCDLSIVGVDGAGHSLSFQVATELPVFEPGIDFYPPTAVIVVAPSSSGYAPFTVAFDASGSFDVGSGIASYGWDFGDGNTGTGELISHTYANSGTYVAVLTVTDLYGNRGTANIVIIVSEIDGPTADIQLTPGATGTVPFTVAFDGSGSTVSAECDNCSIVSYHWNFGDSSNGTGIITTHTYITAGLYPVILTVSDSNGEVGYATTVITVTEGGVEPGVSIGNITVSANPESNVPDSNSTVTAVVTDTEGQFVADGTTVYFLTNNGTLSGGSATTTNGMATVTLTLSNMLVGDTATVTAFIGAVNGSIGVTCTSETGTSIGNITVYANPTSNVPGGTSAITAVVTDNEGQIVADGTTVYFLTNNGALSGGSATTTNGMATVNLTLDASMQVGETATITAFIGAVTDSVEVTCAQEVGPIAVITKVPDPAEGMAPFEVYFDAYASTAEAGIASYEWDFGDGDTAIGIITNHTYGDVGTYTVILTITDNNGNKGYNNTGVIVTKAPYAKINSTPAVDDYYPNGDDKLIEGNIPFKVYFDAYESYSESGIVSYEWEFGDGDTGLGITTDHIYTVPGIYTVYLTITDNNGYEAYDVAYVAVGAAGDVNAVIEVTPVSQTGTAPFTVGLDASASTSEAGTIVGYSWYFNDDPLDDEEDNIIPIATHTYADEGTYLVQLNVEDSEGNIGYAFKSITVTLPE